MGCSVPKPQKTKAPHAYMLRLHPGDDLKLRLLAFARAHDLHAAYVATAVGSLKVLRLRLADRSDETSRTGKFEIVSLVGTLNRDAAHLHLAVAGSDGQTLGLPAYPLLAGQVIGALG